MSFDPEAYLKKKRAGTEAQGVSTAPAAFDPEAYLATKRAQSGVDSNISQTESAVRGAVQGATFNASDEVKGAIESPLGAFTKAANFLPGVNLPDSLGTVARYEKARDAERAKNAAAQKANPKTYLAGEVGGGIASSFVPGLGIAKGASLASTAARMGGQSATAALGASDADTAVGLAKDTAIGGTIGAALPYAGKAIKETAKAVIPGLNAGFANKAVARLSEFTGVSKEQARAYKDMLDNPKKYQQAIDAADGFVKNADDYLAKAQTLDKSVRDAVSDAYKNLEKQAASANMNPANADAFAQVSGEVQVGFKALSEQAADKDFYSSQTRKALTKASRILANETPETAKLVALGGAEATAKLNEMGAKAALEARRTIDDVLYKGGKKGSGTLTMADEKILEEARNVAQKAVQTDLPGASSMKEADALFSQFKGKAESYLKQFTGKDGKPDINKLTGFLKDAGGQNQQAVREINEQRFTSYVRENAARLGLSKEVVEKLGNAAQPLRDAQDLARLGAQSGQSTGRSLLGVGLVSAGGIVAGPVGAAVAAASLPVTNPIAYLATINQMRKVVDKVGEQKAAKLFGKTWPRVKQALSKTAASAAAKDEEKK